MARMMCLIIMLLTVWVPCVQAKQIQVFDQSSANVFALAGDSACDILTDAEDAAVVGIAARLLAEDVEQVTGKKPNVLSGLTQARQLVVVGSIGKSRFINRLIESGKLDVSSIQGHWESYVMTKVVQPFDGVAEAWVIAGSDRRGTAYGVFSLSDSIGVSPWTWWADVPVQHKAKLYIADQTVVQGPPSVKYRGIFINDEDWGLKPWSARNFETDLGDIGPKTYAKVCELLLRLKGNMFAPAMHSCTGAFYSHAESKVVADQYGIIITTAHCEPLLFNNAAKSEWDTERDGEWNYLTNKSTLLKKLDDRVREASPYENIYTMGMRGIHDEGLRGNLSESQQVDVLRRVMVDQRRILTTYLDDPIEKIPQIFVPYKETLDLYEAGLDVPDDVTLVWVDDNYGYLKRVSDHEEQKRSGRAGVYYHTSYLGAPHDYLWLNTTPPVLMYEELMKAYNTGADQYWLLNVGDIKPAELGMQTFFDLAWDVDHYDVASINCHQSQFLADIFGSLYEKVFQDILDTYYQLAWSRKPEFMGWEREWDARELENISDTEFSFRNYNDAQQRLADYQRIADLISQIKMQLPEQQRPAFFEMVEYPVKGSYQMNRKFLMAQLNHEQARDGNHAAANWAAEQSEAAFDEINQLTEQYNTMLDGKWNGMMQLAPGWCAKYQNMPEVVHTEGAGSKAVDVTPQPGQDRLDGCTVIDLKTFTSKVSQDGHTLRVIDGIGYDWHVIQLGRATEKIGDPTNLKDSRFEYEFSGVDADSVTVHVYSVPFWPIDQSRSTRFGVSVDGQTAFIAKNEPKEYSKAWKDQVLQNGVVATAKFSVDKNADKHTLTLTCGDPGVMIQRVVIDWGGLKDTYVGPSVALVSH